MPFGGALVSVVAPLPDARVVTVQHRMFAVVLIITKAGHHAASFVDWLVRRYGPL